MIHALPVDGDNMARLVKLNAVIDFDYAQANKMVYIFEDSDDALIPEEEYYEYYNIIGSDAEGYIVELKIAEPTSDMVNHPPHYTAYNGLEIIDLTEQMNFNRGNAVKYISRAGLKPGVDEIQDLQKAAWYIDREIARLMALSDG